VMLHDAFTLGLLGQVKVRLAMHDYLTPVDDPTSYSVLDGSDIFDINEFHARSCPYCELSGKGGSGR